jgi:hypothetical protein
MPFDNRRNTNSQGTHYKNDYKANEEHNPLATIHQALLLSGRGNVPDLHALVSTPFEFSDCSLKNNDILFNPFNFAIEQNYLSPDRFEAMEERAHGPESALPAER